jgi:hypothetical protein
MSAEGWLGVGDVGCGVGDGDGAGDAENDDLGVPNGVSSGVSNGVGVVVGVATGVVGDVGATDTGLTSSHCSKISWSSSESWLVFSVLSLLILTLSLPLSTVLEMPPT